MTLLEKLSEQLSNNLRTQNSELLYGSKGLQIFKNKIEALKREVNDAGFKYTSTNKLIEIRNRLDKKGFNSLTSGELQRLCSGVISKIGEYPPLVGDKLFVGFIERIRQFFDGNELKTSAWRGLLSAYFNYQQVEESFDNWKKLRAFLFETLDRLFSSSKYQQIWMTELDKNRNLLTDEPCKKYARAILSGDNTLIGDIGKNLPVFENSWFWAELIIAQVRAATLMNDNDFKSHLNHLIEVIKKHPSNLDKSLASLLTRYRECDSKEANDALKSLALDKWNSPFLTRSDKWGIVEPRVRQMVKSWLIYDDLRDFFELLISEGVGDHRRLEFWLKYLQQIEDAQIVLGDSAYRNTEKDYVELRDKRKKDGRLAMFARERNNNAFIMKLGSFLVVEFGEKGNACYVYDVNSAGFNMNAGTFYMATLKSKRARTKWIHRDSVSENWEKKFESNLKELGISVDKVEPEARRIANPYEKPEERFVWGSFIKFIEAYKLSYEDRRDDGGCLWVYCTLTDGNASDVLNRMGFKLKPGKGYWRT